MGDKRVHTIIKAAKEQMQRYLVTKELLNSPKMKAWVVVVVGDEVEVCQEVIL